LVTVNKLVSTVFSKPGEKNYSGESRSRVICPLFSAKHELPVKYSMMRFFYVFQEFVKSSFLDGHIKAYSSPKKISEDISTLL